MNATATTIDLTEGSPATRFWLVVAGWTAVAVIMALILQAQIELPLVWGLRSTLVNYYLLGALVWIACRLDARYALWDRPLLITLGIHVLLGMVLLALHTLGLVAYHRVRLGADYWRMVYADTWMYQLLGEALAYAAGLGLGLAMQALDRDRERQKREAQLEVAAREAELAVIKAQLQPHFLLNSLNSILALIRHDPVEAEHMLTKLASLLHSAFDRLDRELVPLGPELDTIRDYLEIERIRFQDRLRFHVEARGDVRNLQVPPLLLQPIVENAVKHGIAPHARPGEVSVQASRIGDRLHIAVTDTGEGVNGASAPGSGRGVDLTERRLEAQYGEGVATLRMEQRAPGFTVTLDLPAIADVH